MSMATMTADEARTGWGELIRAVTDPESPELVEITRARGGHVVGTPAVAVPASVYDAVDPALLPSRDKVQTMSSSQARAKLRDVLDDAARGIHTEIAIYGQVQAAIVPYTWYQQARPLTHGSATADQP